MANRTQARSHESLGGKFAVLAVVANLDYHWCDGQPLPPGSHGRLPWLHQLDIGVTYRPAFADNKLGFGANVFNEQNAAFEQPNSVTGCTTPDPLHGTAPIREAPRYLRLSVSCDYRSTASTAVPPATYS